MRRFHGACMPRVHVSILFAKTSLPSIAHRTDAKSKWRAQHSLAIRGLLGIAKIAMPVLNMIAQHVLQ